MSSRHLRAGPFPNLCSRGSRTGRSGGRALNPVPALLQHRHSSGRSVKVNDVTLCNRSSEFRCALIVWACRCVYTYVCERICMYVHMYVCIYLCVCRKRTHLARKNGPDLEQPATPGVPSNTSQSPPLTPSSSPQHCSPSP